MPVRDLLLALLVVVVWGVNFVAIRWGVDEVQPLLLTALRFICAALPAVFFIRKPQAGWGIIIAYGSVVGTLQFGFLFTAIKLGMPAGLASLVMQMQAFFTFGLAVWLLGERPGLFQVMGGLVAIAGIGVIGLERLEGAALLPLILTLIAAFCWGASNIITKKAGRIDMLGFVVWSSLVVPVPMLLLSLIAEGPGAIPEALSRLTWRGGGSILFTAYLSTLLGYGIWARLLGRYPANTVAPFTLLVPIAGIGSAALLLGETISTVEIAGSLLVLAGLVFNVFGPRLWKRTRVEVAQP